jgi:hypothetical protein
MEKKKSKTTKKSKKLTAADLKSTRGGLGGRQFYRAGAREVDMRFRSKL